jgi:hypothetical protein
VSKNEDFARPLLEEQLAGLKELADLGREMARRLVKIVARESEAVEPDPNFDAPAFTLALDRAARAVRMSYALEQTVIDLLRGVDRIEADKTDKALRAAEAEAEARLAQAEAPVRARKLKIANAVTGIINDAYEDDLGHKRLICEAERLRDHEVFDNVLGRPASEVIADICRLLGLEPNWEGLAFEAWAQEELESGKVGAALRSPPPWMGPRPGVRGRLLKPEETFAEPPPVTEDLPLPAETEDAEAPPAPEAEIADPDAWIPPPPYVPPPDPDILPGYEVGLPGELPPLRRDGRRARPVLPPRNYTYGFD